MNTTTSRSAAVSGEFVTLAGERYYVIRNVDAMPPFFINLVSNDDHWMFVASNGGLTAGRVSPDSSLFPYITVDKIYDSVTHTGSKTLVRVSRDGRQLLWEPFNREHDYRYSVSRNLYKSLLGNQLLFEEINHDLQLVFRYRWQSSDIYGFVRQSEMENTGAASCRLELVDGLQNILPAGTPRFTQSTASYLVDAYKWSELDKSTGLALMTLFSGISDRAEPCESLRATTVFGLGLNGHRVLLSDTQLDKFRQGVALSTETHKRGIRCAYFVNAHINLEAGALQQWQLVVNAEQSQRSVVELTHQLADTALIDASIARSVARGSDALARIMASGDGFQVTAEENVSAHHYANVLFNVLRGGIVDDNYQISARNFSNHVRCFNQAVFNRHQSLFDKLPAQLDHADLQTVVDDCADPHLHRLFMEYLPITFGRRHGDPSRPWNQFAIRLSDGQGNRLLTYEGNWRDIFQNWEALLLSFPELIESVIAKFVNASTVDGYNPYRITNEGIDWEVEDPEDPWSYIGYWGDHQIIYLLKLLELSRQFHPGRLDTLLHEPLFSYANVPYRIKPLAAVLQDAKSTVEYDEDLAQRIEQRVASLGADGKLLQNNDGQVCQVNLLEKLLVALLAKLGNLVIDGGIWLNTQRPEWNDANNALVGQGLSMVTLYYLRRYIRFMQVLLEGQSAPVSLSAEVAQWLVESAGSMSRIAREVAKGPVNDRQRYEYLLELGQAASDFRETVYNQESLAAAVSIQPEQVAGLLDDALIVIDRSIANNRRDDGLYHAYNLLELKEQSAGLDTLYAMLEGQVAVLSSGAIEPTEAVEIVESLFDSALYRADQQSFLLYPDRELPRFLEKNRIPEQVISASSLCQRMLDAADRRIIERDADGVCRFNASLSNVGDLDARLDQLRPEYGELVATESPALRSLYEQVFNHKAFTGRSGGMFGFEGLGSIYWHMVAKLLLAVQENFFAAREQGADEAQRLAELYYRVRDGIGFNKSPEQYGAFPTDPYSHTPGHAGAQQPGMTGQVKEEMLTRFAELGVRVRDGGVRFDPVLLRTREFVDEAKPFRYQDVAGQWQQLSVPARGLAFSWCQVPVVYRLVESDAAEIRISWDDGRQQRIAGGALPADVAGELFRRTGKILQIELAIQPGQLYAS